MRRGVVLLVLLAGCGGSGDAPPRPVLSATAAPERTATPTATAPRLRDARACGAARCFTLRVPLDRSRQGGPTLPLRVAVQGKRDAPVLVVLSGGPGQPGVPFLATARRWLGPAARKLRLVAIDQRGTGAGALNCPALQRQMGASDLTPPTRAAVTSCARRIGGRRRFFTTADTVEDLEALRLALKADTLALDGVSYGTYVAQRYALANPRHVRRLVLDSVVPADGVSLLSPVSIKATRRVLGDDATRALATVVRERDDGPQLLDLVTSLSVGRPRLDRAVAAIEQAAAGDDGALGQLERDVAGAVHSFTARQLSQGLHASTLCADSPAPWGDASAPLEGRRQALTRAAARLSRDDLYPYDRDTATGNGLARQCLYWPPTDVPPPASARDLPDVPVLLLAGDKDLSTPLEWARRAADRAPAGRLRIVEGAGHGVQSQGDPATLRAVRRFVASRG